MENLSDFNLTSKKLLTTECLILGLNTFSKVCEYVLRLPYARNSDRSNYTLVLKENKGTCATKHAFLKQIAIENNIENIQFCLGIYKMNDTNTIGVGAVLKKYDLQYIPEAHTYLKINNKITDFTRSKVSNTLFANSLMYEETINPNQIGDYKINLHHTYLKQWLKAESSSYSFKEIWRIREACISSL